MDRLHELVAAPEPLKVGDKTYYTRPLRAKHFGEAERYMISLRPKPLDLVLPRLAETPEHLQKSLLDAAFNFELSGQWIPKAQVLEWLTENAEGKVFCFWCMVKQEHQELTFDDAERIIEALSVEQCEVTPDLGMPEGNLPGRTQETGTPELSATLGGESSAS